MAHCASGLLEGIAMKMVKVGRTGLQVSAVGLGCNNFGWRIDEAASKKVITRALDAGITLFDTSDVYGDPPGNSETFLGRILGERRKDITLLTKFGITATGFNTSRSYAMRAVEASLKRLNTDYIDIYMVHFHDPKTPMEETLRVLDDIVRSGKARYIACSNHAAWQVVEGMHVAREINSHAFVACSNEYSLVVREPEKELIPALAAYGLGLMPYFPLASGLLTGKYARTAKEKAEGRLASNFLGMGDRFLNSRNVEIAENLNTFAADRGHSLLDLAMSWLAAQPTVCGLIAGATKPEQIDANVKAVEWALTADDLAEVDKICKV
jgi:aryl-alcohol dehydrogenase-like predicted oxidoreductase